MITVSGMIDAISGYTDFSCVAPKLYVGSKPPFDVQLPQFDMLVLCAQELQPHASAIAFTGMVLRCPIPDDHLNQAQVQLALTSSLFVAKAIRANKRVLVTCQAGINRSALVAALALGRLTKMKAESLITLMRQKRNAQCLYNEHFRTILRTFVT